MTSKKYLKRIHKISGSDIGAFHYLTVPVKKKPSEANSPVMPKKIDKKTPFLLKTHRMTILITSLPNAAIPFQVTMLLDLLVTTGR